MKTNKDVETVSKRRKKWLSSKVLNPKSCAKNRFIYSIETVWTGAMVKLGISHWEAAVPAGAEAQVPPPPRASPRSHWSGPRDRRRLGTAHVRGLPAPPPGRRLTGSLIKTLAFPHRTTRAPDADEWTYTSVASRTRTPLIRLRRIFVILLDRYYN